MTTRFRPRFELTVDLNLSEVLGIFAAEKEKDEKCALQIFDHQIELRIRKEDRHYWSPFLRLSAKENEKGTSLMGRHGPNANVWTMFAALYASISIVGLMAIIFGFSQLSLGQSYSGFWIAGIALVLLFIVHIGGHLGRRKALPQMLLFHEYLEAVFVGHVLSLQDENEKAT